MQDEFQPELAVSQACPSSSLPLQRPGETTGSTKGREMVKSSAKLGGPLGTQCWDFQFSSGFGSLVQTGAWASDKH